MDCMKTNCVNPSEDRMVSCWLCLGNYHLKCSGLKARDVDALIDKSKHLHWSCPNCRIIGVEFYNFFKSYKSEFDSIRKDFLEVEAKLNKYGELFSKFTNLDSFATSPKPKRKRTGKTSSAAPSTSKDPNAIITPSPPPSMNIASISNNFSYQSLNMAPSTSKSATIIDQTVNHPTELIEFTSLSSATSSLAPNVNIDDGQMVNPFAKADAPKPLKALPPRKTIFATRFAYDTSVKDVEFHIKTNLGTLLFKDIQIFKINARNRASFKIIVPENLYDRIVNPNFWPNNTIVRQFIYRDDRGVTLPKATELVQKTTDSIPKN